MSNTPRADEGTEHPPRLRRTRPSRSAPLRNPAHSFGAASRQQTEERREEVPDRDVVQAAVGTAYRVYEEYVRWGQQAAAQRAASDHGRPTMRSNTRDSQPGMQWLQVWEESLRMWMGYAAPFLQGAPFGPGGAGMSFGPHAPRGQGLDLEVELSASLPIRVSLHLTEPRPEGILRTRLHADEGAGGFALEIDPANVRIRVPDELSPGTYRGVVQDEEGGQRGMLTIEVLAADTAGP